ncbi:MAG: hypothetical protein AAFO95_10490 [Cyanobacteria bacterium J06600_6]
MWEKVADNDEPTYCFLLFPFSLLGRDRYLTMSHLVLCYGIWTLIFTALCLRLVTVVQKAIAHLQRLHQIPCDKCAYFTGDYRLKCTVNPIIAMSEQAIGCRDFLEDARTFACKSCPAAEQCDSSHKKPQKPLVKRQSIYSK